MLGIGCVSFRVSTCCGKKTEIRRKYSGDPVRDAGRGREVKIARIFGEDVTPANWLVFKSHLKLIETVNRAKGIRRWKTYVQYQAMMLRLQLPGEPEAWLNQKEMAGESWINDVSEFMCRLLLLLPLLVVRNGVFENQTLSHKINK